MGPAPITPWAIKLPTRVSFVDHRFCNFASVLDIELQFRLGKLDNIKMLAQRTILVTGCSDGSLGSALALALQNAGWRVIASARNLSKLTAMKAAGIECVQIDVVSEGSIAAGVEEVKKLTSGSLDGLVNNAGAAYSTPIIHIEADKVHDLFELNVFSIAKVTRAFLPLLLKSDQAIVVNNTSAVGLLGAAVPFQGAYSASKAAATSLTESLRVELSPFGIRVINLLTGGVQSTFFNNRPDSELPANSIYNVAKEAIESPMAGDQPGLERIDAKSWAKQVAKDLSQPKPPYLVYRGAKAGTARIVSHLPIGIADGILKKMSGIDVLEQKIQDMGGLKKFKELQN
jgi:NAD(P)-dependent dehydrogenase (short-subunit alcohol dehydrogenase family)